MSEPAAYACAGCGARYPVRDGVVSFVQDDKFYEGAYEATLNFVPNERSLKDKFLLYFVNQHLPWAIHKHLRKPGVILDVACGGGMRFLSGKGAVVGLDLSAASLRKTAEFYTAAIQADAFKVPLPDGSCSYIISQFFFEHIPPEQKPALLAEWRRLLASDGRLVCLFDCLGNNSFFQLAKSDADLYKKSFVERDHHYGLQSATENLALLKLAGFDMVEVRTSGKSPFQHLSKLYWLAEYPHKPFPYSILVRIAEFAMPRRILNFAFTAAVVLLDDLLDRVLPLDASTALLVAAKPSR